MHFYNEEFLLPFWIEHHSKLFDHGILIDYNSTDKSREIAVGLAPKSWEILTSRNNWFGAEECDAEVMDHEVRFPNDWKIALNVTEFILTPNLHVDIESFEQSRPDLLGFPLTGTHMVDPKDRAESDITDEPLIVQRHHGYIFNNGSRSRLIHKARDGQYWIGRHGYNLKPIQEEPNESIYCLWYGWSPMKYIRQRKLQIQTRIPDHDIVRGLGREHMVTPEQLEEMYLGEESRTGNMLDDEHFREVWEKTVKALYK